MVEMSAKYLGDLSCELVHQPSGSTIGTDAPKDNNGLGRKFSPTDLVGAALVSCILTTIAMVAERDGIAFKGATGSVVKEMTDKPRRIASLKVTIHMPAGVPHEKRAKYEHVAHTCPVHRSLLAEIDAPINFSYPD